MSIRHSVHRSSCQPASGESTLPRARACCLADCIVSYLCIYYVQAHEVIALEILTLLLEKPTDDSVEIAVGFMKECGSKLTELSPRGVNAIFERMRNILHEAEVTNRVQYMIEVCPSSCYI